MGDDSIDLKPGMSRGLWPRVLGLMWGIGGFGVAVSDGLGVDPGCRPSALLPGRGVGVSEKELKWIGRLMRKHGVTEVVVGNRCICRGRWFQQAVEGGRRLRRSLGAELGVTCIFGMNG